MKTDLNLAKGVRDWYGAEAILKEEIKLKLISVFSSYGYNPIETPEIEKQDTLGFKGGGEIQKEVFKLTDQGNRKLGLRFDHTVPLARFIANNNQIKFPFKRYAIGSVFRDGPTQPEQGRYRIFTQCDVDIVGIKEMSAERELMLLARDAFEDLGLGDIEVKVNNRKFLEGILGYCGVSSNSMNQTIMTLDKMDKIGMDNVLLDLYNLTEFQGTRELSKNTIDLILEDSGSGYFPKKSKRELVLDVGIKGLEDITKLIKTYNLSDLSRELYSYHTQGDKLLSKKTVDNIEEIFNITGSNNEILKEYTSILKGGIGREGLEELESIFNFIEDMGLDFVKFNPSLARGLDYYTGTTIEVYLKNQDLLSSAILAGGRYDNMVGDFRGNKIIPAVGFSFGLERLVSIIGDNNKKTKTQLYIIPIENSNPINFIQELRGYGLNVDQELNTNKKIKYSLKYASTLGIPYVGFVGEKELESNTITLKELSTGNQKSIPLDKVYEIIEKK